MTTCKRQLIPLLALLSTGCAPTVLSTRVDRELVRTEKITGPGHDRSVSAVVREDSNGATLVLTSQETCNEQTLRVFHRHEVTERKANVAAQVGVYVLAAAGVGLGAVVVGDAHNVPEAGDPTTRNPVTRTSAYALGATTLSLGAGLLAWGVATMLRGGNLVTTLEDTTEPDGEPRATACNQQPVANQRVTLAVNGATPLKLGISNSEGRVEVRWDDLRALVSERSRTSAATGNKNPGDSLTSMVVDVAGKVVPVEVSPKVAAAMEKLRAEQEDASRIGAIRDALAAARQALADGDLDKVDFQLGIVEHFRGDVGETRAQLVKAREAKGQALLTKAWRAVKANRPDEARDAQRSATDLGVNDQRLDAAIEQTPAAKQQKLSEERLAREVEQEANRAERKVRLAKARADQAAKQEARDQARELFNERCPRIYENAHDKEVLVELINEWANNKFGAKMTTAQAASALRSLGSRTAFVRKCRARAGESTSCGTTTRAALRSSDGALPQMWKIWRYESELACMEQRPERVLQTVALRECGMNADDDVVRMACFTVALEYDP